MRETLDKVLCHKADQGENILLLLGDMGVFPDLEKKHPEKVLNTGCMESNMVNFACGLAAEGYKVVIYTLAGFTLYKAYDQIKYMIPLIKDKSGSITIYNGGAGFVYNEVGPGHYILNDLALLEHEANIFIPKSRMDVYEALWAMDDEGSFNYIRGGEDNAPGDLSDLIFRDPIGTIVTTGTTFSRVSEAVKELGLKINVENLYNSCPSFGLEVSVIEDHQKLGGVASILHGMGFKIKGHKFAPHYIPHASPDREEIWRLAGFGKEELKNFILRNYGTDKI